MAPRYRVTLTKEEREELEAISSKGKRAARTVLSARALLLLDAGEFGPEWVVANEAEAIGVTTRRSSNENRRKKPYGYTHWSHTTSTVFCCACLS